MRQMLQPHIERDEPGHRFALVRLGGDTADVYLDQDHMMANHIEGERLWDLFCVEPRRHDG